MYVSCEDLLKLPYFSNCTIHTKDIGLSNIISWPYVAKALLEENLFYGGEFVIIAETYIKYDESVLLDFVDICKTNNISGILFFINHQTKDGLKEIPKSVIEKASENNIPVMELPWDIRSIDIVKSVSFAIFENERRNNALDACLKNILFFDNTFEAENLKWLQDLNYNDEPYYLLRIQLFDFDRFCHNRGISLPIAMHDQKKFVRHTIMNNISYYFPDATICFNSNIVTALISSKEKNKIHDGHTINELYKIIETTIVKLSFGIFVSTEFSSIKDVKAALHQTTHLLPLRHLEEFNGKPVLYDDIGAYKLIIELPKSTLNSLFNNVMAPLIEADCGNDNELVHTIRVFLKNNMNMEQTSNELFIHNNTIRYRLKKIESITGMSLKSIDNLTTLYYCTCIMNYLDITEHM